MNLFNGDCLEKLKLLEDNSIDSVVTDPPYGLAFMGKKWDYDVPSVEIWKEVLRVLKPGGHLLSFGGTRTYHRMVINIEDAGFEIRDQIMWIYGSGFPKSMDISKAIDKQAGVEGPIIGKNPAFRANQLKHDTEWETAMRPEHKRGPASEESKQWQGWGTALKPANEPICLARKPISEKTVAANVLKHGTGAMNIDESRIPFASEKDLKGATFGSQPKTSGMGTFQSYEKGINATNIEANPQGRWPANVIFDEEAAEILDQQTGILKSGAIKQDQYKSGHKNKVYGQFNGFAMDAVEASQGGASRFFYCAKTSKAERNAGLEGMPTKKVGTYAQDEWSRNNMGNTPDSKREGVQNFHPTVKPIKLMSYLIKLITPPGGTVLDPFMGSGSTGVAAKKDGFKFIGIERDKEYFKIAKKRVKAA